jgi:hypothetical protein
LRDEDRPALAAAAYVLHNATFRDDKKRRDPIRKALDHWLLWAPEKRVDAAAEQISAVAGKAWAKSWADHVEALAGRRKRYRMTHPFGGRS